MDFAKAHLFDLQLETREVQVWTPSRDHVITQQMSPQNLRSLILNVNLHISKNLKLQNQLQPAGGLLSVVSPFLSAQFWLSSDGSSVLRSATWDEGYLVWILPWASSSHVTTWQISPQHLLSAMLTFATEKLLTQWQQWTNARCSFPFFCHWQHSFDQPDMRAVLQSTWEAVLPEYPESGWALLPAQWLDLVRVCAVTQVSN